MSPFPSPHFSAIEQYLFLDNRASYPLDFFYRLRFDGAVDADQLNAAFRAALKLHPLLRSVASRHGRHFEWAICETQPTMSELSPSSDGDTQTLSAIDLTTEPGTRLFVVPEAARTTLLFQFHHATTDGLGAMGFVQDVLLAYSEVGSTEPTSLVRNVQRLAERHWCGFPNISLFQKVWKQLCGIYLSREFLNSTIAPLVGHQPQLNIPRTSIDRFKDIHHTLSIEQTAALKQAASCRNVSANTLLIRDAFIAMDAFRKTAEGYSAGDYFRIAVPGNIRSSRSNDGFPAANFFSMTFPARRSDQIEDHTGLLESVHQEVRKSRTDCYFAAFIVILKGLRLIPGALEKMVNAPKCQASMLLTNVGAALTQVSSVNADGQIQLGLATLQSIELVPPLRPFQSVAVALVEYAGRQTITLSYDPRIHTEAEATTILEAYVNQIESSFAENE